MNKNGINLILYPRTYNKRGDISLHSVQGVTPEGKVINVKLRLEEAPRDIERAPSIAEFSREDRKAKQACIATPDNGPDNREGVLLFSRAHSEGENKKGVESYVAKWAAVLSSDSDSPEPVIGLGRMEIVKTNRFLDKVKRDLNAAIQNNVIADIERLEALLTNSENYKYPAILYYPEELNTSPSSDIEKFRLTASVALTKHTAHGVTGGLMVRLVNKNKRLIKKSYQEFFSRYITGEQRYQTAEETISYFIENNKDLYFSDSDLFIDFIPIARINNGPRGNKYYGKTQRYDLANKLYYASDESPLLCQVAIRVTIFDDTDNTLLSRMNAISAPLGHPMRLDSNGRFSYLCTDEEVKLAQKQISTNELVEIPIGLSVNTLPSRALWMIMGEDAPASNDPEIIPLDNNFIIHQDKNKPERTTNVSTSVIKDVNANVPTDEHIDAPTKVITIINTDAITDVTTNANTDVSIDIAPDTNIPIDSDLAGKGISDNKKELNNNLVRKKYNTTIDSTLNDKNELKVTNPDKEKTNITTKELDDKPLTGMAAFLQKRKT